MVVLSALTIAHGVWILFFDRRCESSTLGADAVELLHDGLGVVSDLWVTQALREDNAFYSLHVCLKELLRLLVVMPSLLPLLGFLTFIGVRRQAGVTHMCMWTVGSRTFASLIEHADGLLVVTLVPQDQAWSCGQRGERMGGGCIKQAGHQVLHGFFVDLMSVHGLVSL